MFSSEYVTVACLLVTAALVSNLAAAGTWLLHMSPAAVFSFPRSRRLLARTLGSALVSTTAKLSSLGLFARVLRRGAVLAAGSEQSVAS